VGLASAQSTQHIFMKNLLDMSVNALGFFVFGYGVQWGEGALANSFLGGGAYALHKVPELYSWFVQFTFTNNVTTICSGPLAGRTRLFAYLVLSLLVATWIYPVAGHWVWARKVRLLALA